MKNTTQIYNRIRKLKYERKQFYLEMITVHEIRPEIAVIGCARFTTQIKELRWTLED